MSFKNKVVAIMGASDGIGAAAAVTFAKEEASVVIVGRNEAKLKNVGDLCKAISDRHLAIKADITKDEEVVMIFNKIIERYGKLDVLVNSAMVLGLGSILDGNALKAFDNTVNVNLRSLIQLTMSAVPHLIKTKGNIININGIGGQKTLSPCFVSFCLAEAARDHFTRLTALELGSLGVRVNCVSAGPVNTNIVENSGYKDGVDLAPWADLKHNTALGRMSEPEEIADLIIFLASEKARSITGAIYNIDNGNCLK